MMNQEMYPMDRAMQGSFPDQAMGHHQSIPIYSRQMHPISPTYNDQAYGQGKYGHYVGNNYASPGPESVGLDRSAHRNRVMSEQQINTYKPFQQPPPSTFATGMQHQALKSKFIGHGQSFSHIEDGRYQQAPSLNDNQRFAQSLNEIQLERKMTGDKLNVSPTLRQPQPDELGFQENVFTFKAGPAKDKFHGQQGSLVGKDGRQIDQSNPKRDNLGSSAQNRLKKLAAIKQLEEEIKATKDKLKYLEETLKLEYATVEEDSSDHEVDLAADGKTD